MKKKTHGAIVGVHTTSGTAEKRKWQILNPRVQRVEKRFSKYVHAVYNLKALEELNNFYKRTIGKK